jgi:hypothetical protein
MNLCGIAGRYVESALVNTEQISVIKERRDAVTARDPTLSSPYPV